MRTLAFALVLSLLGLLSACDSGNVYKAPPPPQVGVAKAVKRQVTEYLQLTGNTQAKETVDIRARVEGYLQDIGFQDGSVVKTGQMLFVIEPKPYEEAVASAKAELESAKATLSRAEIEYARAKKLFAEKAGPETDMVRWEKDRDSAKASVDMAKSKLETARINLSYTRMEAPFNGRISRHMVDKGNLVGSGTKTLLTTIVRDDPMYAYFTLAERDVLRVSSEAVVSTAGKNDINVELGLGDGMDYPYAGRLDFSDNTIDPNTGTLLLRGVFGNEKGSLVPGLFVRVRIGLSPKERFVLPETAVMTGQQGQFVLAVGQNNTVEVRPVKASFTFDGLRVVESGLDGSEDVVVIGVQLARPGSPVTPQKRLFDGKSAQTPLAQAAAPAGQAAPAGK